MLFTRTGLEETFSGGSFFSAWKALYCRFSETNQGS